MHVTACVAGQKVDVEVGEDCRTLQALRESIVVALPQLCVEGFDVSVGGRALDDDEGVVSLQQDVCLDVSATSRVLSVLALREAGREVSEAGLLRAAKEDAASLVTLFLDAGVPIDCVDRLGSTPLHLSCGNLEIATLLLDRGSTAIMRRMVIATHLFTTRAAAGIWDEDVDGDDDEEDGDDEEQDEEEDEDAGNGDDGKEDGEQDDDRREDMSREESEEETPQGFDRGRHASIRSGKKIRIFGDSRLVLQQVDGKWPSYGRTAQQHRSGLSGWRTRGMKWNSFMSYGVSTRKRTRWRTPAWTGRQRTRRISTFDRCRRTRHPANGWRTAVNSPWKVYHLRRSVRAA